MTIFLANPSKQHVTFHYRDPRNNLARHVSLASGTQKPIGAEWGKDEKASFIRQIERFGARDAAETHRSMGKFLGLLYRIDFAVDSDEIHMGHDAVVATQKERSAEEATRGALGFDRAVQRGQRGKRLARVTEVSVEEEVAPGERRTGDEVTFSLAVDPEGRTDAQLPV